MCREDALREEQKPHSAALNDKITLTGIPLEAYEYVVNGKSAMDWGAEWH